MAEPLAYVNGQFVPGLPTIPAWDAGFVFGATVTDLCRTFRHRPFRLDEHIARFRQSCRLCRVPLLAPDAELGAAAEKLLEHNAPLLRPGGELAVVMLATPGPIGYYAGHPGGPGDGP